MKTVISANVDGEIASYLKANRIPKSELINTLLKNWIASHSSEYLQKTILEKTAELDILKSEGKKTRDNVQAKVVEEGTIYQQTFDDLLQGYRVRREAGIDRHDDIMWITGPRNKEKCLSLGLSPEMALSELRGEYRKMVSVGRSYL